MEEGFQYQQAVQTRPFQEGYEHNMLVPQLCWCFADLWCYYEADGSVAYCVVDHKYAQ